MDKINRNIIANLQDNGRMSLTELGDEVLASLHVNVE